jgi:carboxymethylenebutenolidase
MTNFEQMATGDSTVRAYVRVPEDARAGLVVLHAWWGLNDDVMAYADRLVDAGFAVLAPDMFDGQVATEIADAERLSAAGDEVAGPIALAATDALAARLGPDAPLAILGFSFGAAHAIWAPSERERLAATVAYYGSYWGDFLGRSKAALLGHFAETDPYEPAENVRALEQGLRDAGREATIHRYPGTGHWFAEPSRDAYRQDAAELAFERTTAFLRERLGDAAAAR